MVRLRLLADDLTGALDSAARFVPATGSVAVRWNADAPGPSGSVAVDSGTRDLEVDAVRRRIERFLPTLEGGEPAFKKIDSLLRGHVALELAACLRGFDHCVLAPAFPFQGRITRNGRQLLRSGDGWRDTGVDLEDQLRALGVTARMRDAETDDDLDAIVDHGRRLAGRVLWCGTGGLAGALAGRGAAPRPMLRAPLVALIGSDHAVSRAQIAAVSSDRRDAVVVCDLPSAIDQLSARRIAEAFATLLRRVPRPGTLFVTGGETLRDLCEDIGVTGLEVDGEIEPGVPTSVMRGGDWDGQRLVSKSGAFGDTEFLARLLGEAR